MSIDLRKDGVSLLGDIKYVAHTWHEGSLLLHLPKGLDPFSTLDVEEKIKEVGDFSEVHVMWGTKKEDLKNLMKSWERVFV